jgi:Flp pilus assembly protein TadG
MALMMPLLLLLLGLAFDGARMFFITNAVTNAAREGALYASHHGDAAGGKPQLEANIRTIMGAEDSGSLIFGRCASWPAFPGAPSTTDVTFAYGGSGNIPVPNGGSTTITVQAKCSEPLILGFLPMPNPVVIRATVSGEAVAQQ